ncbi:MAG TPA: hypothetical protein VLA89_16470 [Gemmatimonadales bacterium]|nr:hypothetical protein [Gemmatimonadales bacterium]
MRIDPIALLNLGIYALATWGIVAGLYFSIKSDLRSVKEYVAALVKEKDDQYNAVKADLQDHEIRLRLLERNHS